MASTVLVEPDVARDALPYEADRVARTLASQPRVHRGYLYCLAVALCISAYLAVWLVNFHDVYGWVNDDRITFTKGNDTVQNWKAIFAYYNAYHADFLLYVYPALKTRLSLPSYPLPTFGEQTGQFRFLLLSTVFAHAGILALWAWFATRLTRSRVVAFLSLLLFATSPTLQLWTPQPDSRLLGLPFILAGLAVVSYVDVADAGPLRRRTTLLFLGGTLFWLAESVHYTSLYLLAPYCVVLWGLGLWRGWRSKSYWINLAFFSAGCLWLEVVLEFLSHYVAHLPWLAGPTATLVKLHAIHTSAWSTVGGLSLWSDWFLGEMGPPLLVAIAAGWVVYLWQVLRSRRPECTDHLVLTLTIPVALLYLAVSGSMQFFRQTSVLQPFMFLFGAAAIVEMARRLTRRTVPQLAATLALLGVVGILPWGQAYAVFQAHQGLGRAIEWAYANKGERQLEWLQIAWFGDPSSLKNLQQLEQAPPDSWLISYNPWQFFGDRPSLRAAFEATPPLASWPTLYSTHAAWAEFKAYGYHDFRNDPAQSTVRVDSVADILQRVSGGIPLRVQSVTADSVDRPQNDPTKVFDQDASPAGETAWISAGTPMPHFLEIRFAEPVSLGRMQIVLPPTDRSESRISALDVQVADEQGAYRTVWSGDNLANDPVVAPEWEPTRIAAVKLLIRGQTWPANPVTQATVEEIVFPGYHVFPLPLGQSSGGG